ncbi:MAG: hypothetical protein ACYDH3_05825 [Candidatus Aminicenantales bacterium]
MFKGGGKPTARLGVFGFVFLSAAFLRASNYLFFLEIQGVAGYSSADRKIIAYSMSPLESMQKPSLGFDYVQRFSGQSGDIAVLSVQGRLAWNSEGDKTFEPQLYNAFLKFKMRPFDVWIGHDRPAFGLSSILDNHALLLPTLSMMGFGFDRDWGLGLEKDTARGRFGLSLTAGSGMGLKMDGNYFLSGRYGFGVLNEDNITAGLSLGYGKIRDVAGYTELSKNLIDFAMASADVTWLRNNLENRVEIMAGKRDGLSTLAAFWRFGIGFLDENRLKLEFQPTAVITRESKHFEYAGGLTYLAHPDWTLRAMVAHDPEMNDTRVIFQVYYYKGISF